MSKLIVVCGYSGSGKTTLSTALSRQLNIVCIHKDSLKVKMHEQLGITTRKAFLLLTALVEEQLENDVDLIIDATFDFAGDEDVLKGWEKRYGVELTCVTCQIDPAERQRRMLTRERHVVHAEGDAEVLAEIDTHTFDYTAMPGKHIFVTTNGNVEKSLDQVLARLS